jgi:hypothetical protein
MGQWKDRRHLKTCANMMIGLILSASVSLTKWIPYTFGRHKIAQSAQRRYIRWLENTDIHIHELYAPLIKQVVADWEYSVIYLAFDTSMLWNNYCIIRISIIYRGRAIPLAWDIIEHKSSTVAFDDYKHVLYNAFDILKDTNKRVIFMADRGFADTKLMDLCEKFNWKYRIRIKSSFTVHLKDGKLCHVEDLCPEEPGTARYFHYINLTGKQYGPVHLAVAYDKESKEKWYVVSNELTSIHTFEEYRLRFDIEENFLDDRSNGFQLESFHDSQCWCS